MNDEKDSSGTRLTEGASVSVSAPDTASHAAPTPGPWTVKSLFVGPLLVVDRRGVIVAGAGHDITSEAIANAELIAAAPELLELMKELCESEFYLPSTSTMRRRIEAAIAKAEGRTP
jgi:hypothetical protein